MPEKELMVELKANLEEVSRESVEPEKWSKKENPVTRKDLGKDFRTIVQFDPDRTNDKTISESITLYTKLGDVIHPGAQLIGANENKLPAADFNDFKIGGPEVETCQKAIQKLVDRGIYILSISNFLPYNKGACRMTEPRVPVSTHQWLLNNCGRLFAGYEVGEQDGRYLSSYARKFRPKKKNESDYEYYYQQFKSFVRSEPNFAKHFLKNYFKNRKDAYEDFKRWMKLFEEGLHHYLTPIAHTNFAHYLCELDNARIIGAELALILINHQVAFAFLRGAARQYGLLFWCLCSVWSRWGVCVTGTPLDLARRIWYLSYMYGASMLGIEYGYFERSKKQPALSGLGKLQVAATKWCQNHPARGVQYNPVAVMLDFYNGWLAPKHGYQYGGERRMVWNAFPYQKGDHQIDNFFRLVFPGYEEGSYHRDGKGTFVPTPYGDIFDVVLSNTDPKIIKRYNVVIALGDIKVTGKLKDKLKEYVSGGGDLIIALNNISGQDEKFYGIKFTKKDQTDTVSQTGNKKHREAKYTYYQVKNITANVLLKSGEGDPLIIVNRYGKGRVISITADYWMTDLNVLGEKKVGVISQKVKDHNPKRIFKGKTDFFEERNWDCPYNCAISKLIVEGRSLAVIEKQVCCHCQVECTNDVSKQCDILEGVKEVLGGYFSSFLPFEIEGPPVHYLVNLVEDRKKIIITVANHGNSRWKGNIRFKASTVKVLQVKEWMEDKPVQLDKISIGPKDLKVMEIVTGQNII